MTSAFLAGFADELTKVARIRMFYYRTPHGVYTSARKSLQALRKMKKDPDYAPRITEVLL